MILPKSAKDNSIVAAKMCELAVDQIYHGWVEGEKKEVFSMKETYETKQAKTKTFVLNKDAREDGL